VAPRSIHALPHGGLTELALAGFGEGAGHSPLYQTIRRDNTPSRVLYYRSPTANPAEVAGQGLQCRRQHHAPENSSGPRWTAGAPRGRVSDLADKLTGDLQINSVCSWTRERSRCCLNSSLAARFVDAVRFTSSRTARERHTGVCPLCLESGTRRSTTRDLSERAMVNEEPSMGHVG